MMPPIALLSDLGTRDYFVGAMKGAILSINPSALVVDLTHEIPKQDVRTAAFVLVHAAETFPPGTIFVVVVDPGVGTKRKCLLLEARNGMLFVGPDNGVLSLVAERFGVKSVREISNPKLMRSKVSSTFHGRDVMAPVAAHLSLGVKPSTIGPKLKSFKRLRFPRPKLSGSEVQGEVLTIDDFGNLVTNIGRELLSRFASMGSKLAVRVGRSEFEATYVKTFGEVKPGERLVYVGSSGLVEVAKNFGNLADELGTRRGDRVRIKRL